MSKSDKSLKERVNPLVVFASVLSAASIIWTTYSIADLFRLHSANPTAKLTDMSAGAGWIGFTVAAGADLVWGGIIYAQYKGKPYMVGTGKKRFDLIPILGWLAVIAVIVLISWHGHSQDNTPMMVGGPFLPLGAKVMWMLALNNLKDDTAPTEEEQAAINAVIRQGSVTEQMQHADRKRMMAEHEAEMDRIRMEHEKEMAKLSLDAEKDREEDRLRAERAMARDENYFEIRRVRAEKTMAMEISSPIIAGELAAPENVELREPMGRVPSNLDQRRKLVSLPINRPNGLTEAQMRQRILAAAWYYVEANGLGMTQREFCDEIDIDGRQVSPPDLSKAKSRFPMDSFSDEELRNAYNAAVGE